MDMARVACPVTGWRTTIMRIGKQLGKQVVDKIIETPDFYLCIRTTT